MIAFTQTLRVIVIELGKWLSAWRSISLLFFSFRLLDANSKKGLCPSRLVHKPFDLIYTDYIGTFYLNEDLGASTTHFRYN